MLLIPKKHRGQHKIPSRNTCDCRPPVWDLCQRHCLAKLAFFPVIYLLRLNLHCDGSSQLSCGALTFSSIYNFILICRRGKKTVWIKQSQSDLCIVQKCYNFRVMLIATLSYCKFEIIPLQRVNSAAKFNVIDCIILVALRTFKLPLLTDRLQSVLYIQRMPLQWKKWIFPHSLDFLITLMDLRTNFNGLR